MNAIAIATRNTGELESIESIIGVPIADVDITDYNTALEITSRMIISMEIIMLESINLDDVVTSRENCAVVAIDIARDNLGIIPTISRRHDSANCEISFHLKEDQHVDNSLIQPPILC